MKKLLASIVCFSFAAMVATAGGEKAASVNGTWIVTAVSVGNKKAPEQFITQLVPTGMFKDGKYQLLTKGKVDESGTYKLDANKKPATIDLMIEEGSDKGKLQLGIYKLEGDMLTMAVAKPGEKTRPKNFDPAEDVELQVMKRKK